MTAPALRLLPDFDPTSPPAEDRCAQLVGLQWVVWQTLTDLLIGLSGAQQMLISERIADKLYDRGVRVDV